MIILVYNSIEEKHACKQIKLLLIPSYMTWIEVTFPQQLTVGSYYMQYYSGS